jgi:hypothetical protein
MPLKEGGEKQVPLISQLQIKLPIRMRKDHTQLSPAEIEAQTHSRSLAERYEVLVQFFRLLALPALRIEDFGFREDGGIVVHEPSTSAYYSL